jgi:hypothetical protein
VVKLSPVGSVVAARLSLIMTNIFGSAPWSPLPLTVEVIARHGFGTSVIGQMIQVQLRGEMRLDWRTEGVACEIVLQTPKP